MTGFTYRGLREFNPLDIGATWDSVSEWYFNPHQQCFECIHDGHHIILTPDLIGYQDGRIHITYHNEADEAWLECLPEPGQHYLHWRLIGRSGEIRREMIAGWDGHAGHPNLRWLWGHFDCLPKAILVLVAAAVIKSAGYRNKGMFLHEINPAVIREDWMYPYISIPAEMSDEEEEKIHDCFDTYRRA